VANRAQPWLIREGIGGVAAAARLALRHGCLRYATPAAAAIKLQPATWH